MDPILSALGLDAGRHAELAQLGADHEPARVTRVDRGLATALGAAGEHRIPADGLAVGDWVALAGDGVVAGVLERRTALQRETADATRSPTAASGRVVAANVDHVLVIRALDMPVRTGRVLDLLALAHASGAAPAVVLSKADASADPAAAVAAVAAVAPGTPVLAVSATRTTGLDALRALVAGGTFALLGESGAGKSTLVNTLAGREVLATAAVDRSGAGRHTTTYRQLVVLDGLGVVIDTPGVRTAGFRGDAAGLASAYADIDELAAACRFADCTHVHEPGCAVRGAVPDERLAAYRKALREEAMLARRDDPRRASDARRQRRAVERSYRRDSWR